MFTVALIGVDGAGKTTVAKRILKETDLKIRYVYMGANPESSNVLLPTTRFVLWLRQASGKTKEKPALREMKTAAPPKKKGLRRLFAAVKPYLWLVHHAAEEWYRQFVVWSHVLRGSVVIFDRHFFFDYYAYDIVRGGKGRPLPRRFHGWMLNRLYPKPDLVIFLDAPVGLLYSRKPEASLAYMLSRREEYVGLQDRFKNFFVVDASQPEDAVVRDVLRIIEDFHSSRKTAGLPLKRPAR